MNKYTTETGFYILKDADGRIGAKANVPVGEHPVPEWVDMSKSFDVGSADELMDYEVHNQYYNEP